MEMLFKHIAAALMPPERLTNDSYARLISSHTLDIHKSSSHPDMGADVGPRKLCMFGELALRMLKTHKETGNDIDSQSHS